MEVVSYTVLRGPFWLQDRRPLYSFEGSSDYVYDVAWSPAHPAVFATVDGTGRLDIWNLNFDTEVPAASVYVDGGSSALNRVTWTQSGQHVVVGDQAGKLWVYDLGDVSSSDIFLLLAITVRVYSYSSFLLLCSNWPFRVKTSGFRWPSPCKSCAIPGQKTSTWPVLFRASRPRRLPWPVRRSPAGLRSLWATLPRRGARRPVHLRTSRCLPLARRQDRAARPQYRRRCLLDRTGVAVSPIIRPRNLSVADWRVQPCCCALVPKRTRSSHVTPRYTSHKHHFFCSRESDCCIFLDNFHTPLVAETFNLKSAAWSSRFPCSVCFVQ